LYTRFARQQKVIQALLSPCKLFCRTAKFCIPGMVENSLESIVPTSTLRLHTQKETIRMDTPKSGEFAHIGKSVVIKGELSGSEDLYVDGTVEGAIQLQGNNLVIGPNGHVHADVNAKGVVIQGKLEGNIRASDRAELRKSAVILGDIVTQRIAIEDGAYFKGKVEIQREGAKPNPVSATRAEPQVEAKSAAAAGTPVTKQ
jgi:cytoskeletal protein CcmA (bactofilin family)